MRRLVMIFAISFMAIVFNSCQKSEIMNLADDTTMSNQETQADKILTNIDLMIEKAISQNLGNLKSASHLQTAKNTHGQLIMELAIATILPHLPLGKKPKRLS